MIEITGAPGRIRTSDPQIRSLVLRADSIRLQPPRTANLLKNQLRVPTSSAASRRRFAAMW
jgi:hypothetical protein